MNVLIACEESQRVCIEMRKLGHRAFSCDILECSGGHPEWHIQGDVLPLLNGGCAFQTMDGRTHTQRGRWDLIVAFPPCTKTSNAGARHLWKGHTLNIPRYYDGLCGKALFMAMLAANCEHIAVENPTPSKVFDFPLPTQAIQPWQFGHPFSKKTLLWLIGLPPLEETNVVNPERTWCPSGSYSGKHSEKHRGMFTTDRAKNRAKTFPGIARAMAEQWTSYIEKEKAEQEQAQYMDMLSPTYSDGQLRDGCWFCHNQGVDQLRQFRRKYPDLWAKLMRIDADSPVTFHADGHTVRDFDRRFALEDEGLINKDEPFRWALLDSELNYRFEGF